MKNIITEMKILLGEINSILDNAEEKINELEDIIIETIHNKCRNYILSSECPCF